MTTRIGQWGIQGLGYALFEERILDQRLGLPLNPTMHDDKVSMIGDIPVIDAFFVDTADPVALGREISESPLTPWRILANR